MPDLTNTEIAAALDELGDLSELDGAAIYRVVAYRNAAKAVRESPVSVLGLARQGRATELPGVGAIIQEKIIALADDRRDPGHGQAAGQVPARRDRDDAPARLGTEAGAAAVRGARDRFARDPARRRGGSRRSASSRASAPRPRRRSSPALRLADDGERRARVVLDRALAIADPLIAALRDHPASDARRAGRLGPADDRHGQGPRHHRHRDRPARAGPGRHSARPRRVGRHAEPRPVSGFAPTPGSGSTCGSSRPISSATCSST